MAQYAREDGGGQQGAPFGYSTEWPSGFNSVPDTLNQGAILNSNESAFISDFFSNPDAASMSNDNFSDLNWEPEAKVDTTAFGYSLDGFDQNSQTVSNPGVTLAGAKNGAYETHSNQQHTQMPMHSDSFANEAGQASEEDYNAASGLFNLSAHGHQQQGINNLAPGASWGNLSYPFLPQQDNNMHMQSPMTSSGRQSSNSHHSISQNQGFTQQQHHRRASQQHYAGMWPNQPLQHVPRSHHPLQNGTETEYRLFNQPHMRAAQPDHPRVQSFQNLPQVSFGTDNSFGSQGYHPPNGWADMQHEKSGNLVQVPLAAQAAARGRSHAPVFTPESFQRHIQRHSAPSDSALFHNTNSSPNHMGGLPMSSPTSTNYPHSHPFNQMAHRTTSGYNAGDEPETVDRQSRKRRKSQAEREEDAEYDPYTNVKASTKRVMKMEESEHEYEDDEHITTPSRMKAKASVKRRRSTVVARASPDSDDDDGSPAVRSDSGEPASSTRRKSRKSDARNNNLSEEQKRMNHIKSEKTRRDLIKIQYDTLDELVPALKGGKSGLSRADILKEIVDYLENTVSGNRTLSARLQMMGQGSAGAGGGGFG
ncbi:hypothetical protein LTR37_016714 [Vermiconidia calcicola]|uniref:Uncharacterized protein n=1 Tax=Vermiconidia calcicola TaxID=1690605 RepID=A0ACC3MNM1_9PEZI|nr:hypothetical protein LTR37_016714 [Vermiconidia calcicola]